MMSLFPPARIVPVPGRGEMFLRDSGEETDRLGVVLLLHGWFATADVNWVSCYAPLIGSGYRVLAVDHRGHGRGIRSIEPFRLTDCAEDATGLIRYLGVGPVFVVGYSMGGPIAQLMAHRHPDLVRGLVLSATAMTFDGLSRRRNMLALGAVGFGLRLFSRRIYLRALRRGRLTNEDVQAWLMSSLMRHDPASMAEAGRELARFNSRAWVGEIATPAAVVATTRDNLVPPHRQSELQRAIPGAKLFEVPGDHVAVGSHPQYVPQLLAALEDVRLRSDEPTARAEGAAG
jgi:3-oxoadipate enol-lactonase